MDDKFLRNIRQLDLACRNRDLAAARRLWVKAFEWQFPGRPIDLWKIDACMRIYAAEMHG